ncbi:MAG: MgtC/SapB family protein [Clostridium sp.]|uniref:MgtC/SapB family protein n=1 Tax=Clostridium sp. TaxID=1506 RepID=UPI003EE5217A
MNLEIFLRLILSGIIPGIIGLERDYRSKEAGFRTHFLVGLGSGLIMLISIYGFTNLIGTEGITVDISKMGAQIVSGIGFIGAGTIILNKNIVKGLTTSASIWVSAGIGMSIGTGLFEIGTCTMLVSIICLEIVHLFNRNREFKRLSLKIYLPKNTKEPIENINKIVKAVDFTSFSVEYKGDIEVLNIEYRMHVNEKELLIIIDELKKSNFNLLEIKIEGG